MSLRRRGKRLVKVNRFSSSKHANAIAQGQPALVTFVTAGYPSKEATVPLMIGMESGGADVIELGVPFSDPIADGPTIQETNVVCHPSPAVFSRGLISQRAQDSIEE